MRNIRLQFVILAMVFASFGIIQLGRALQDFTETIFGHPQPAKNPWKRVRIVSRSTFAGNS